MNITKALTEAYNNMKVNPLVEYAEEIEETSQTVTDDFVEEVINWLAGAEHNMSTEDFVDVVDIFHQEDVDPQDNADIKFRLLGKPMSDPFVQKLEQMMSADLSEAGPKIDIDKSC